MKFRAWFGSNAAAMEIGHGVLLMIAGAFLVYLNYNPFDHLWLRIAVSGLLGMGAARAISFNIERVDSSDEKMRRWIFGVYMGLWFGAWLTVTTLRDYDGVWAIVNFLTAGGVYGGLMATMNRSISLANASEHGYDVTQLDRGFHSIKLSRLQVFNCVVLAFNVSQLLSRERLVGPDHHSGPLLFCAVLALLLAWTPRAYRPLDLGRLGDVALTMRLALSFAVIGGVAAPFFLG